MFTILKKNDTAFWGGGPYEAAIMLYAKFKDANESDYKNLAEHCRNEKVEALSLGENQIQQLPSHVTQIELAFLSLSKNSLRVLPQQSFSASFLHTIRYLDLGSKSTAPCTSQINRAHVSLFDDVARLLLHEFTRKIISSRVFQHSLRNAHS
jgi:hypothetical protein